MINNVYLGSAVIMSPDYQQQFQHAKKLQSQGLYPQAERLYLQLRGINKGDINVLTALSELYLQQRNIDKALPSLIALNILQPSNAQLLNRLIQILSSSKQWPEICACYERFYQSIKPSCQASLQASSHASSKHRAEQGSAQTLATHSFNYAYYLKLAQRYTDAIAYFNLALNYNIERCEDVYLSIGVIYAEHLYDAQAAEQAFLKAIENNVRYTPAYYNLATLYEEKGDKDSAIKCFMQTLKYDACHCDALSRLAELHSFKSVDEPLISQLKKALQANSHDSEASINLNYALGKAFDECGLYQQAFCYYQQANANNKKINRRYSQAAIEALHKDNILTFNKAWFENIEPISDKQVIFICGMFRSGSTLTEQILASHPKVSAAGELDFIPNLVSEHCQGYPRSIASKDYKQLQTFANEYCIALHKACPNAAYITDKRPDNFLYIGLIKTLFPNAKIIHTTRNKLDNCLSIYFLRLGELLPYATNLADIRHYYEQQELIMAHWQALFPNDIFTSNYESLVHNPKQNITALLSFLKLDWDDNCLQYPNLTNRVKTASVWKVRKPLFTKSIGRWENYEPFLD